MIYSFAADVSKDKFDGCLLAYSLTNQTHEVIARRTFDNTQSGFKAAMKWTASRIPDQAPVRATMEATGVYHEPMALFIDEHYPEIHLAVVLPSKSKQYKKSRGLRSKTDKIDAYGLALMGAERSLDAWGGIDPFWRQLRALTRTRVQLMEQRTALRNRLHALDHSGVATPRSKNALQAALEALTCEIKQLTSAIYKKLRSRKPLQEAVAWLKTIPGVGRLTIASILGETNGFERFESISQLISFSGYDVVIRQSGKWTGKPKISKQGSSYIRRAMYMPASTVVRSETGPTWELYQRLVGRRGVKMKAHVAVQKKLLRYMYVLWNNQESFDPSHIRGLQDYHQNVAPSRKHSEEATVDTSSAAA